MSEPSRSLRGRLGAYALHATHDPRETTKPARAAFLACFYEGIPEELPQSERDRRAEYARKLYFARLALKSAQGRRKAATP